MFTVQQSSVFATWLRNLKDRQARGFILKRLERMERGLFGSNVRDVGQGVSEMKIDAGPGYRVYFKKVGRTVLLVLVGGDKRTQAQDIRLANKIAAAWKE